MTRSALLILCFFSFHSYAGDEISDSTLFYVDRLAGKPVALSLENGWSGTHKQFDDFKRFQMIVKDSELMVLLGHKDPYIRYYSFKCIAERDLCDLYPFILESIHSTARISFLIGDAGASYYEGDVYIRNGKSYIKKERQSHFDSLICFADTKLDIRFKTITKRYDEIINKSLYDQQFKDLLWIAWDNLAIIEPRVLDVFFNFDSLRTINNIVNILKVDHYFLRNYYNVKQLSDNSVNKSDSLLTLFTNMLSILSDHNKELTVDVVFEHLENVLYYINNEEIIIEPILLEHLIKLNDNEVNQRLRTLLLETGRPYVYYLFFYRYESILNSEIGKTLWADFKPLIDDGYWSETENTVINKMISEME